MEIWPGLLVLDLKVCQEASRIFSEVLQAIATASSSKDGSIRRTLQVLRVSLDCMT